MATLTRYKTDWRESEGGCSESELVQLESQIDDNMAYYREHYEDFLACS
ncbi:hypothetical protein ACFS5M_09650 [Lacinutrix iliipiscaria]|uniref:Uncharacterized protein n=1 Tax=Lacinutrix iliipiscaria TaxID=1230532 RepID=A0ABW5WPR4_9FLAO